MNKHLINMDKIKEDQTTIFTYLSPEIQEFLGNQGFDLIDHLKSQNYNVERGHEQDIMSEGTKDATAVILASAALAVALGPSIKMILETILNRPVRATILEKVPIYDDNGKQVLDNENNPKYKLVPRTEILQPTPSKESTSTKVKFWQFEYSHESDPKE